MSVSGEVWTMLGLAAIAAVAIIALQFLQVPPPKRPEDTAAE